MPQPTIYSGDTLPLLTFTAVDELQNPVSLVGATCYALFARADGQPGFAGAGTFTSVVGNTAVYQLGTTDTTVPGLYQVQLVASFAQGDQSFEPVALQISPRVVSPL